MSKSLELNINFTGDTASLLTEVLNKNISAFRLGFGARTILFGHASNSLDKRAVYVCSDIIEARRAYAQISALNSAAVFLPPADENLVYRDIVALDNYAPRLTALFKAVQDKSAPIVTCIESLSCLYPCVSDFTKAIINIKKGDSFDLGDFIKKLVASGYKRNALVEGEGEFSLRGDILDIYPIGSQHGVRIEFFGDDIESIAMFDPVALLSGKELSASTIPPATEIFYDEADADSILAEFNRQINEPKAGGNTVENYHRLVGKVARDLQIGSRGMRLKYLMPLLKHSSFGNFFNPHIIFFDDAKQSYDTLENIYLAHENRYKIMIETSECYSGSFGHLIEKSLVVSKDAFKTAFHSVDSQNRLFVPEIVYNFSNPSFSSYARNYDALIADVNSWRTRGNHVVLYAGSKSVKENLNGVFGNQIFSGGDGRLDIVEDILPESAAFFDEKIILIGTNQLTGNTQKAPVKRNKRNAFTEPKVGSHVVHRYHGIGFCESVKRLKLADAERDYVVIKYSGGDTLYVPVENMDSLSHYDKGESDPKLQRLGGAEFTRIKERVKESIAKMAVDLSTLYAARSEAKGYTYVMGDELLDSFCADFIHTETDDQLIATAECIKDLRQGKIMDRLLCGDVGYGKTEVALRTAFKVIVEGKQVAFLSPTTILARQHFNTVKNRMASFGVKVASLTRFDSASSVSATLDGLRKGTIDIVCGTHRLLSKDVGFKDLGLLILDEEQRFGVADKEKIKALRTDINVLTLTATPIPRTLHLSLSGIRDISVLDTAPSARLPVKTYVTEYSQSLLYDAVMREIGRGGQVFIIYNRVETMAQFVSEVKSVLPEGARVDYAHGQMSADKLEDKIVSFTKGEFDVLIASTIIENGIDMPNANTMIVVDADRFGLAQLYQLRGRVGRSNRLAYAYFTFDAKKQLTETAHRRLEAIVQFTELGSGFKIAMRDLEIRGAGNVLGREQHGHIDRIGYDMYCKILAETIEEAKTGKIAKNSDDVKVSTDFNAFLPDSYVIESDHRQRVYARVSQVNSKESMRTLRDELKQVYGVVPVPLENLMLVALVKNLCSSLNAIAATLKKKECSITFAKTVDIPKSIAKFNSAIVDMAKAKVGFGIDREAMLRFLLEQKL